jgi:hypothetical protein
MTSSKSDFVSPSPHLSGGGATMMIADLDGDPAGTTPE